MASLARNLGPRPNRPQRWAFGPPRILFLLLTALAGGACIEEATGRSPGNIGDNPGPTTSSPKDSGAEADRDSGGRVEASADAPASDAVSSD